VHVGQASVLAQGLESPAFKPSGAILCDYLVVCCTSSAVWNAPSRELRL
jgi:hypothetical protein